ncbi:hypothetical protein D3C71_1960820 [compost metagenome]
MYFPGPLPINEISARAGLAHPFGHPVIRMTISSSLKPFDSRIGSILSRSDGKYLSDSAIASPQVGKETQAIEFLRSAE